LRTVPFEKNKIFSERCSEIELDPYGIAVQNVQNKKIMNQSYDSVLSNRMK
jgi:hypothetical protein